MLFAEDISVAEGPQNSLGFFDRGPYMGVGKNYAIGSFVSSLIEDVRIYTRVVHS